MHDEARMSVHERIAGRRLRVAVYDILLERIVAKSIFDSGADVIVGGGSSIDTLIVPGWPPPSLKLISAGHLYLGRGMRLHMCHDNGEDRVVGEYEELAALGMVAPLRITVSKLNVRIRKGVSVFAKYLSSEEPDWPVSEEWAAP